MKGYVQVYRNLHRTSVGGTHVYSVRGDDGRVKKHVENLTLKDCSFRVGEKGRQRVLREKRKNVHAYIQGKECKNDKFPMENSIKVQYNPYKNKFFINTETNKPIFEAKWVQISGKDISVYL